MPGERYVVNSGDAKILVLGPGGEHFGAVEVDGDTLWVQALYSDKLFELRLSWPS